VDPLFVPALQQLVPPWHRIVPILSGLVPFQPGLIGKPVPITQNWTGQISFGL
jgi:hypothetical protein